jgi:hypothetical protein
VFRTFNRLIALPLKPYFVDVEMHHPKSVSGVRTSDATAIGSVKLHELREAILSRA